MTASAFRLRKHADYQRVYKASPKQFGKQMSYFFLLRPVAGPRAEQEHVAELPGPRVGLTVPKGLGKAVDRNRIKRRMREVVRRQLPQLGAQVDVVLHPRRSVIDLDFTILEREVGTVFRAVQKMSQRQTASSPAPVSGTR